MILIHGVMWHPHEESMGKSSRSIKSSCKDKCIWERVFVDNFVYVIF